MDFPDTHYARTEDGTYIAYQAVGEGPTDIAWLDDAQSNLQWEDPWTQVWYRGLTSFSRLILHDRRAVGLSSRNVPVPNLETRASDLRAVLDAAGSEQTVIGGWFEGLAPGVMLAATEPGRVRALVWWNPLPRTIWAPDYPWGWGREEVDRELRALEHWGTMEYARIWAEQFASSEGYAPPEAEVRAIAKLTANTCTPDVAEELTRIGWESDIRGVLPSVHVPTLLIAGGDDPKSVEIAEYVASLMPRAEIDIYREPHEAWTKGDYEPYARPRLEAIQRFIGLEPARAGMDSILATVLFTDIVSSTEKQAALGDLDWKALVERHHAIVRDALIRYRGVEIDNSGDGFFASFDGPARTIRCALDIAEGVSGIGLEIRAGVHTGECELINGKIGGIAVTIGSRIAGVASASEVLVSQTVKDLVAGSGFTFEDAGEHELKGVPGRWHLYRVLP